MYVRREEEKQKAEVRILVAAVKEIQEASSTENPPGSNRQQKSGPISRDTGPTCFSCHKKGHLQNFCPTSKGMGSTCFYCHKKGHLQKECRKRQQDEKIFQEED